MARYLRDRGGGVQASIFGTYIHKGELLVYPFVEYTRDRNREYQPAEFGLGPDVNFRGKFHGSAGELFVGYGVTDWLALEVEGAYRSATLDKSPQDSFATPGRIKETGLADIEGQLRARVMKESDRRPELFTFAEITARSQRRKLLIADPVWDLRPGIGLVRGFSWGTVSARVTGEWNRMDKHPDFGEVAVDYLKRLSPRWRLYLAIEGGEGGAMDEWDFVSGLQLRLTDFALVKLDNAVGISSKATDWAPQIGVMFSFP